MDIRDAFISQYGETGVIKVISAPGRINMIGEHTDYNDGFVLPAAIDKYVTLVGALRNDRLVKIYSQDLDDYTQFSLDMIKPDNEHPWVNYLAGVIYLFLTRGYVLRGMNLAFTGNIPIGTGLSSSAALEVATAYLLKSLHEIEISPIEIIKLCQRAENDFVGVKCGIMDQYISCLGRGGQALLIDCRTLEAKPVPLLNHQVGLVIANTKVKHNLVESGYNQRKQECEEAVKLLSELIGERKRALRDVTIEEFAMYGHRLPELIGRRAKHVINENQRVLTGMTALTQGKFIEFGKLMIESHQSLRNLYQVSCSELDLMVDLACQVRGVYGSRMTGGGFGGCTVSLVQTEQVTEFVKFVGDGYVQRTGIKPEFYICSVVDGAELAN